MLDRDAERYLWRRLTLVSFVGWAMFAAGPRPVSLVGVLKGNRGDQWSLIHINPLTDASLPMSARALPRTEIQDIVCRPLGLVGNVMLATGIAALVPYPSPPGPDGQGRGSRTRSRKSRIGRCAAAIRDSRARMSTPGEICTVLAAEDCTPSSFQWPAVFDRRVRLTGSEVSISGCSVR